MQTACAPLRLLCATAFLLCHSLALENLAAAAVVSLQPVADTYFETYGSDTKNFGSEPVLRMDQWHGRQVFLRFPLSGVPQTNLLSRATLKLRILQVGANEQGEFPELKTGVGVYDVVTPWTENGLTFVSPDGTNAWRLGKGLRGPGYTDVGPLVPPDFGVRLRNQLVPLDPGTLAPGAWLELDVTAFLREHPSTDQVDLLVKSSTLGRNYSFHSREAAREEDRPVLELQFAEGVPAAQLRAPVTMDWRTGRRVQVGLSVPAGTDRNAFKWTLAGRPATSRLATDAVQADSINHGSFTPDVPGRYRVELLPRAAGYSGPPLSAEIDVLSLGAHPRMYVTPQTLPELRGDKETRLFKAFLVWVDGGMGGAAQGKFHDMGPHEGCEHTAVAWLLTQDRKYLAASMAYADALLRKPMREHFEDVHAATFLGAAWVHAMALHYDYCHAELDNGRRAAIAAWLKEAAHWADARSSAPVAHNDGGARQCLLASAALALLGDDPEAGELHRMSRRNFDTHLLPWLNDGGQGGRSGDGGEYEGLHGFYIVRYAWMSHTATGEDIFSESPFFKNRLKHILFGWYPRKLVERTGAYSMRQYYSPSGDHIRMGYVGDTQPYQSAAALCARYRDTEAAANVRWLAGDWPTRWMQYTLRWAVLGRFESVPAREPSDLAWFDRGCNTVFARSDWTDDATWLLFENAPFVSAHGSLDSGTFEIFKGDLLAARTGNFDHANVGASHTMNYMRRTIAANAILVFDPEEKWRGFLGGAQGGNDGGGQRTNFPLGSSPEVQEYLAFRELFQRGQITRYSSRDGLTYAFADVTPAYNNLRTHGGNLNRPKVSNFSRQIAYLRELDSIVVFDRVSSVKPEFRKTWLLHSLGELDVIDGTETRIDEGESHFTGASRAVIRYGWPKPVPSFGRCLSVTLLPGQATLVRIGGRVELPPGETQGFGKDQWHGKHRHRHIKDFWVAGTNYPPGNPPETRWFGEPGSSSYVSGTPDESGGRGKWRLEVSPPAPALDDVFLHVLCPRLGTDGSFPEVELVQLGGHAGAAVTENGNRTVILFSRDETTRAGVTGLLPSNPPARVFVADLAPGDYRLEVQGQPGRVLQVGDDKLAVLPPLSGDFRLTKTAQQR